MNGENIIPKITDKRGMSWNQPHRRYIEIDEEYALMTLPKYNKVIIYLNMNDRRKDDINY